MNDLKLFAEQNFIYIVIGVFIFNLSVLSILGNKALKLFPPLHSVFVIYSGKLISGYSTKSFWTKRSRANNVIQVVVTSDELWIKSHLLFAFIMKRNDLLQRIPFSCISDIRLMENSKPELHVEFSDQKGQREIVLLTHKCKEIQDALQKAMRKTV